MKSFHIITFGCQMNEHDSERMAGILSEKQYAAASGAADADLVILNTCSIREKAEQKFYSELGRLRELQKERPGLKIAVAGCIAQQEGSKLLGNASHVDLVLGPSDIGRLGELLEQGQSTGRALVSTEGDPEYHLKRIPSARAGGIKAWVSIMHGCDNFCTYCVVPYLRGRERSRTPEHIVDEVRDLAARGFKEVTLLGQNVNSYGKGHGKGINFPVLLRQVNAVQGIERIRFVTSHPRDLSDELIAAMRDLPKVCEALHLPVQSGSDRILKSMNRGYDRSGYLDKVRKLREAVPGIALTTDIIVGFPGETRDDFEQTMSLLSEVRYANIFSFRYSTRPGTAALAMPDHLSEPEKEARLASVQALQRELTAQYYREQVGQVLDVLFEGRSRKGGKLAGRTRGNTVVNVEGDAALIGTVAKVRITRDARNSLHGELCA